MMKKFRPILNQKIDTHIMSIDNVETVKIYSSSQENEGGFKPIVNVGDIVKMGQPVFSNGNQKIPASVSGTVTLLGTTKDIFNNVVEFVEIKNDFKNDLLMANKPKIKNREDLIKMCKDFSLQNDKFYLSFFFEKLIKNELYINADFGDYNNQNYIVLVNFINEINNAINLLQKIFNFNYIKVIISKNKKNLIKKYLQNEKIKLTCKKQKNALNFIDLLNIFNAYNGVIQTNNFVAINGGAIAKNGLVKIPIGTKIEDIINFLGGFKQDIEEIENFKYTALLAYNDEVEIKQKIKATKNKTDKERLKKLLKEKMYEAKQNIYSHLPEYHQKFLNCLAVCCINDIKNKNHTKNFDNYIQSNVLTINFLSNKEFI